MEKIVEIYNNEPRSGTWIIATGFKRDHKDVLKLINKHKDRFLNLDNKGISNPLIIRKVPSKKAGRRIEEYMLNEAQTIFLGSIFRNSEIVLDFKEKLARDYVKVKRQLDQVHSSHKDEKWLQARLTGKALRHQETDTIKKFIEYAKEQGGSDKGCNMYYSNITRMMNGALFIVEGKYKVLRDVMSAEQLMVVGTADQIINKALKDGMKKDIYFKDIYKQVKANVIVFAELHGQSKIIELLQLQDT